MSLPVSIPLSIVTVLTVSIPLCLVNVPKLVLSLPLSAYLTAPVTDLKHLSSRLANQTLPAVEHIGVRQNNSLIFTSLSISSPLLSATAMSLVKVHVDHDFSWTVSFHGILLEADQCQALSPIPRQITCAGDIISLLSVVHASRICCGNNFKELVGCVWRSVQGFNRYVCECMYTGIRGLTILFYVLQEAELSHALTHKVQPFATEPVSCCFQVIADLLAVSSVLALGLAFAYEVSAKGKEQNSEQIRAAVFLTPYCW